MDLLNFTQEVYIDKARFVRLLRKLSILIDGQTGKHNMDFVL